MKNHQTVTHYIRLYDDLKQARAPWVQTWKELATYLAPTRGLFEGDRPNNGRRINHKVLLDSSAGLAAEVLSAGMMSGLTSPSRSWFNVSLSPAELARLPETSLWLLEVKKRLEETFAKSNLYGVLHGFYHEISVFGTAAFLLEEDLGKGIRARLFTAGEYVLGSDEQGRVNTFGREFSLTGKQLLRTFGDKAVPTEIKQDIQKGNERSYQVIHLIFPNEKWDATHCDNKHFAYTSVYLLRSGTLLRQSGYHEFPVIASRWEVKNSEDTYGRGPGWKCLGDVKMLQKMQKTKLVALDKSTNPPMMVSANVQGEVNLLPGGITRYNGTTDAAVKPAYEVRPDLQALDQAIENVRHTIKAHFFADVFTMLSSLQSQRMTAAEVAERHEEKMLVLGPVLERLKNELLDPLIHRTFCILLRQGVLPSAPSVIQGAPLHIEYTSMIAQAQKAAGLRTLLQGVEYASLLAQNDPSALLEVDYHRALEEGLSELGLSYLLKSPSEIKLNISSQTPAPSVPAHPCASSQK